MAGGKKRGASSGGDGSGRGGKKRAVVGSSPGSGSSRGSSGKDRAKADSETRKMDQALESAYKLSNACKQHTLKDVGIIDWKLKTDQDGVIQSSYAGFKGVLDGRRELFKKVTSLLIHGVVVTQPSFKETFHIINIEVDDKPVLQLLFRQSDGYLVAFRRVSTKDNPVWEGWYYFKDEDIDLPSFCEKKARLGIESGYNQFNMVMFGKGVVSDIVKCLCAFTQENCALRTYGQYNRVLLLETLMVLFGECQRSGVFLEFAENHYESDTLVQVTDELSKHRHSWIVLSRALMALYLGFLYRDHGLNGWKAKLQEGEDQMNRAIGSFTKLGHNNIKRFIVYQDEVANYTLSMQNLLGSDVGQLLHLIKYDEVSVQEIYLAMMKVRKD